MALMVVVVYDGCATRRGDAESVGPQPQFPPADFASDFGMK
jgi:hypothetical protein